jgi:hypothetical protein
MHNPQAFSGSLRPTVHPGEEPAYPPLELPALVDKHPVNE